MSIERRTRLREWLFQIHTWCGLLLALYAILIGVSGSLLVFRSELQALEHPEFYKIADHRISTTVDQVLAITRQSIPEGRPLTVTWPNQETPYWMSYVLLKSGAREVYVDPASGLVRGIRDPTAGWSGWIAQLHTSLLAGAFGRRMNSWRRAC